MNRALFTALFLTIFLFPLTLGAQEKASPRSSLVEGDYVIGPGDVLFVSIWKDESLTQNVPVRPDGKISFPLVGEITAGGRSVAQLKEEIENKITGYVPDPTVSVGIQAINSLLIYVIGRVNNPGRFVLNTNINVARLVHYVCVGVIATASGVTKVRLRRSGFWDCHRESSRLGSRRHAR